MYTHWVENAGDDPADLTYDAIAARIAQVATNADAAVRIALDKQAIPRCREWREANPELIWSGKVTNDAGIVTNPENLVQVPHPAPYCCSAYCPRCAGLRELDGVEPLLPNGWMHHG